MKITTKYNIDDIVTLKPLSLNGRILAIRYDINYGIEYSIRYFVDNAPKYEYFREDEVEKVPENACGFSA